VGRGKADPFCFPNVFTNNRDWLPTTDISRRVMAAVLAHRWVVALPFKAEGHSRGSAGLDVIYHHVARSARRLTPCSIKDFDAAEFVVEMWYIRVIANLAQRSRS
jgi:hypothetical protein